MYGIRGCMDAKERACTGCTVFAVAWMQKRLNLLGKFNFYISDKLSNKVHLDDFLA
jgi:hypothetical protein